MIHRQRLRRRRLRHIERRRLVQAGIVCRLRGGGGRLHSAPELSAHWRVGCIEPGGIFSGAMLRRLHVGLGVVARCHRSLQRCAECWQPASPSRAASTPISAQAIPHRNLVTQSNFRSISARFNCMPAAAQRSQHGRLMCADSSVSGRRMPLPIIPMRVNAHLTGIGLASRNRSRCSAASGASSSLALARDRPSTPPRPCPPSLAARHWRSPR